MQSFLHGVAEYLTPVLTSSQFQEKGVLTPEEFVLAGDQLTFKCPTWQWYVATWRLLWCCGHCMRALAAVPVPVFQRRFTLGVLRRMQVKRRPGVCKVVLTSGQAGSCD